MFTGDKWFAPDWHLVRSTINKPVLGKPNYFDEPHTQTSSHCFREVTQAFRPRPVSRDQVEKGKVLITDAGNEHSFWGTTDYRLPYVVCEGSKPQGVSLRNGVYGTQHNSTKYLYAVSCTSRR